MVCIGDRFFFKCLHQYQSLSVCFFSFFLIRLKSVRSRTFVYVALADQLQIIIIIHFFLFVQIIIVNRMVLCRWLLFIWLYSLFHIVYIAISFCRSRVSNNFTNTLNWYDTNKRIICVYVHDVFMCTLYTVHSVCVYIVYYIPWLKINCSFRCCLSLWLLYPIYFSFFSMENVWCGSPSLLYTESRCLCEALHKLCAHKHTQKCMLFSSSSSSSPSTSSFLLKLLFVY